MCRWRFFFFRSCSRSFLCWFQNRFNQIRRWICCCKQERYRDSQRIAIIWNALSVVRSDFELFFVGHGSATHRTNSIKSLDHDWAVYLEACQKCWKSASNSITNSLRWFFSLRGITCYFVRITRCSPKTILQCANRSESVFQNLNLAFLNLRIA